MKFRESQLAHQYLDGLIGIEIGASAHNPFGLNTMNVDKYPGITVYKQQEFELCGEMAGIDVVAEGDDLPFNDKDFDFVIVSHVIEHFWNPIKALKEWDRVARKWVFLIVPHRNALPLDVNKPLTTLQEFIDRDNGKLEDPGTDEHHSRWTPETFVGMCEFFGFTVELALERDDKVGNGFCVILNTQTI